MVIQNRNTGFTLPEMILVVVVLGIFLTMVFPDITRLMQFNAEKIQEANMKDIQIALEARSKDVDAIESAGGVVFSETAATLQNYLAPYTKLPVDKITTDEWGQDLLLKHVELAQTYRGLNINVNYFAALSLGPDGVRDANTTFPTVANPLTAGRYANIEAGGDDYVIKFTDYTHQVAIADDAYNKIQAIENRLEAYAEARLAEYIDVKEKVCDDVNDSEITGNERTYARTNYPSPPPPATVTGVDLLACYENEFGNSAQSENRLIFYPPDHFEFGGAASKRNLYGRVAGPTYDRQGATDDIYDTNLNAVLNVGVGANTVAMFNPHSANTSNVIRYSYVNNRNNRGAAMVRLMRIIGLPDEYCCTIDEEPFYYYSNPGDAGCTRPGIDDPKRPAKVTIEPSC